MVSWIVMACVRNMIICKKRGPTCCFFRKKIAHHKENNGNNLGKKINIMLRFEWSDTLHWKVWKKIEIQDLLFERLEYILRGLCQSGINSILKLLPGLFSNETFFAPCSIYHSMFFCYLGRVEPIPEAPIPNELHCCLTHKICKQLLGGSGGQPTTITSI